MNAGAIVFLVSESIKLILSHLSQRGSLNTLTQAQAEVMVKSLADALPTVLPTPEELENPPQPPSV